MTHFERAFLEQSSRLTKSRPPRRSWAMRGLSGIAAGSVALLPWNAMAHTDSLGFIVTSGSSVGLYDVEIFYGSWHTVVGSAEGALDLSQDGSLLGTETFTLVPGFNGVSNGTVPAGLVAGTNYFFPDTTTPAQGDLTGDPTGHSIYAFQSATFLDLTPGTYTFGYNTGSSLTVNWTPSDSAINNGSFTITSGGGLGGVSGMASPTNIDTAQSSYLSSNLGSVVNPAFEGGELLIDENGQTYSQNFSLDDSGTNQIDPAGNQATFSGVYSDTVPGEPGGIIIDDSGSGGAVTFSGVNTYTGATVIRNGTLALSGSGSIAESSGVEADGTFDISATSAGATIANLTGSGTVELGAQTLTIANAAGEFAGNITGAGGLTIGSGFQVLSGDSDYTGDTDVLTGELRVNGSLGNTIVTVGAGATLSGTGTIDGAVQVLPDGTLAPGESPGTITVATLSLSSGSVTEFEYGEVNVVGGLFNDLTIVTGAATIDAGAILDAVRGTAEPYVLGGRYTVIDTAGGVTGEFTLTGDTRVSTFFGLVDTYDANHVYLDVAQTRSFAAAGRTSNQIAAAEGADSLDLSSPLYVAIGLLQSDEEAAAAFDLISGEIHASAQSAAIEDSRFLREAEMGRLRGSVDSDMPASVAPVAYASYGAPAPRSADESGWALWGQPFGSWGKYDGDGNAASMQRRIGGGLVGVDREIASGVRVGAVAGFSRSEFEVDDRASEGHSNNYHAGLYGGVDRGPFAVRAGAGFTWHDIDTSRSVAFPGFVDTLSADYDARTFQLFGEVGYRIDLGKAAVEPFGNVTYVRLDTDGFAENGGPAALTVGSSDFDIPFTTLGFRGTMDISAEPGRIVSARAMLGWRHAFGDTTPSVSSSFAGGSSFAIAGVPVEQDAALVEAGLGMVTGSALEVRLFYSGVIGPAVQDHGIKATVVHRF